MRELQIEHTRDRGEHLEIASTAVAKMTAHARHEYPAECCGVLLGTRNCEPEDGLTSVVSVIPAVNVATGDRSRRFAIAPELLLQVHKSFASSPIDVVGFYHSHPTGSAIPSRSDREAAWPGVSYVIVGVEAGPKTVLRSWRVSEDGARFYEESVGISPRQELRR